MCSSCEVLRINGVVCHESGCPEAWKDEVRECGWCGQNFKPEDRHQECCSHSCEMSFCGIDCNCEECNSECEVI